MVKTKKQRVANEMAYVLSEKFGWEVNIDNRYHCDVCNNLLRNENYCPFCGTKQNENLVKIDVDALYAAYKAGKKADK